MAKLDSDISKVINRLISEDRVKPLSYEQSSKIDHDLALEFKKIKSDFDLKEKKSRSLVARIELSSLNR